MDGCQSSGAASCKTLGIFCSTRYGKVESHHLWLHSMFNYVLCLLETLGCSIDEKGFHQVELQIAAWDLEVEKIGFCVLYKHDIEDRNWGKMEHDDTFFCWWWNLVFEIPIEISESMMRMMGWNQDSKTQMIELWQIIWGIFFFSSFTCELSTFFLPL